MDSTDSASLNDSESTIELGTGPAADPSAVTKPIESGSPNKGKSPTPKSSAPRFEKLGDYTIQNQIGRGGMGEVYLATEQELGRQVALKVLPAAARISQLQVKRFLLEARAAAQLSHDHIVPIYHIGESDGVHYFTMRYIEGQDLSHIIRSAQRAMSSDEPVSASTQRTVPNVKVADSTIKSGSDSVNSRIDLSASSFVGSLRSSGSRSAHKLAVSVALIGQAVAEALQHAHEHGIIHRDIKPSNLMLDQTNKIWVTDFGLAQLQDAPALTVTGDILGTLRYMSPEQATGRRAFIDHRTDIYSLGVTLYELATLQRACRGETAQEILRSITFERPQPIRKVNPKLPRDLETIIGKATERNPSDRYQSAEEMAADLRRFANNESLEARRPGALKRARSWAIDRPGISALIALSLFLMTGSSTVIATLMSDAWSKERASRETAEQNLEIQNAQSLLGQASLLQDENPAMAMAAAIDGSEELPGLYADRVTMAATDRNHELKTLELDFSYPGKCAVSSDGSKAVACVNVKGYAKSKQSAVVVDLKAGKKLGSLTTDTSITDAAFLEGTQWLLTNSASSDGRGLVVPIGEVQFGGTKLWNAQSLQLVKEFPSNQALRISPANYSRINQQLVIANNDNSATIYNLDSLNQAMVLPRIHQQPVVDCRFSYDGSLIVTWSLDNTAILWDAKNGQKLHQIEYVSARPSATHVCFTVDSKQLCISGEAGTRFISCSDARELHRRSESLLMLSSINPVAYFYGPFRTSVLKFNTQSHQMVGEYQFEQYVAEAVALASDRYLAGIVDESIVVFNLDTSKRFTQLRGHKHQIQSMASVAGESQLISFGWDGTLRYWDVHSDLQRRTFAAEFGSDQPLMIVPNADGTKGLVGSIRDLQSSRYDSTALATSNTKIKGKFLIQLASGQALTTDHHGITGWDLGTQRKTAHVALKWHAPYTVRKALELPASGSVAVLTEAGEVYIWSLATGQLVRQTRQEESAAAIALDHTGHRLVIGLRSGELITLDYQTESRISTTRVASKISSFELHPERNELVIVVAGGKAVVWDVDQNKQLVELAKPGVRIIEAKFVAGDRIVTHESWNSTALNLWNKQDGSLVDSLELKSVYDLAVRKDGQSVAVSTKDGVYYWDLLAAEKLRAVEGDSKTLAFIGDKLVMATGNYELPGATEKLPTTAPQLIVWNSATKTVESSVTVDEHITNILPIGSVGEFLTSAYSFGIDYVDLKTNSIICGLANLFQPLVAASFKENASAVVTVSGDGKIWQTNLSNGQRTLIGSHEYPISAARVSDDKQLLITADQVEGVRVSDLGNGKVVRQISTGGQPVSRLTINKLAKQIVMQVGAELVKHLDLRTGIETDFKVPEGVRDLALSPDGQTILVATGKSNLFPSHPAYTQEMLGKAEPAPVLVLRVDSQEPRKVLLDGFPVGCQFLNSGEQFAILSSLGLVHLFDLQSLKPLAKLESDRRIMQLLESPRNSKWLFTASKNQIAAWNPTDGSKVQELNVELSDAEAMLRVPHDLLTQTAGDFYWLYSTQGMVQRPIDAISYAKQVVPRLLTAEARQKLLGSKVTTH